MILPGEHNMKCRGDPCGRLVNRQPLHDKAAKSMNNNVDSSGRPVSLAIIPASWYITIRIMCEIEPRHFEGWWPIQVKA